MKIVITDSEFPSMDIEREVASKAEVELVIAHGLSPEEVIANAEGGRRARRAVREGHRRGVRRPAVGQGRGAIRRGR